MFDKNRSKCANSNIKTQSMFAAHNNKTDSISVLDKVEENQESSEPQIPKSD
jgi:hypothetical protein